MIFLTSRKPSVVRNRVRIIFSIFGIVALGFVSSQIAILASQGKMRKIDEIVPTTHYIHSFEELNKIATKNMSGNYVLMSNIEINGDSPLYDNEKTLNGVLDGNGFNIVLKGNITHSFLYKISSSGVVKNLGVFYENECTFNNLETNFGGIAYFNEGHIEDSFTILDTLELANNHLIGGICAVNRGNITHAYSKLTVNENESYLKNYVIGGVAASHMSGTISKCYSEIHGLYVANNIDEIISETKFNPVEGNFVGSKSNTAILENLYSVDYHLPYIDRNFEGVHLMEKYVFDKNSVLTSDNYELHFSTSVWNFDAESLKDLLFDNCSIKEGK